jgi:TonB family protein
MLRRLAPISGCVALCSALAGCATPPAAFAPPAPVGDVGIIPIEACETDRYPVVSDETYEYPAAWDDNLPPTYPQSLLARRLEPVRVKVRMIVDEGGRVTGTQSLDSAESIDPEFFAEVQRALSRWTFLPLIRRKPEQHRFTTLQYHGTKRTYGGVAVALPFHQDYEFWFTQRDGVGSVSAAASPR